MQEILIRQLAASLWAKFERTAGYVPEGLSGKDFEQLGAPAQNVWLGLARHAVREISRRRTKSGKLPARRGNLAATTDYLLRRANSTDFLLELLSKVLQDARWAAGTEGRVHIELFQSAYKDHKKLQVELLENLICSKK